jgi:hypothetical protein
MVFLIAPNELALPPLLEIHRAISSWNSYATTRPSCIRLEVPGGINTVPF